MKRKEFFYLSGLYNFGSDLGIKSLLIEEISYGKCIINFVLFTTGGEQNPIEILWVNKTRINKITLDDIHNLNIHYSRGSIERTTSITFNSPNISNIAKYINTFLLFIKNNNNLVEKHGFREQIRDESILSRISLKSHYEKVINLKTHRLSTSASRVGKDNNFYEYMVISHRNDGDYYFIKLLCDFMQENYNLDTQTMTVTISSDSAWAPYHAPYTTPDNFESMRADFIQYITEHFDYNEGCRYALLDMPLR